MFTSTLIFLISHPTMDPKLITNNLVLSPTMTQKAGDQIITPKGRKVAGTYKNTKWSHQIGLESNDGLCDELLSLVDHLFSHREFLRAINDGGGSAIVYFNFSNAESFSMQISPEIMEKITKMKMSFGFEMFE